jgi:hypothetical protein
MDTAQVKAFRLIVNRSVTWADWDETLLSQELLDLNDLDYDLDLTGFEDCSVGGPNACDRSTAVEQGAIDIVDAHGSVV